MVANLELEVLVSNCLYVEPDSRDGGHNFSGLESVQDSRLS